MAQNERLVVAKSNRELKGSRKLATSSASPPLFLPLSFVYAAYIYVCPPTPFSLSVCLTSQVHLSSNFLQKSSHPGLLPISISIPLFVLFYLFLLTCFFYALSSRPLLLLHSSCALLQLCLAYLDSQADWIAKSRAGNGSFILFWYFFFCWFLIA